MYTKKLSKGSPFKEGSKTTSIPGCSGIMRKNYPDTQSEIYRAQEDASRKVKASMSKASANQRF